jgi:hypothetical protein
MSDGVSVAKATDSDPEPRMSALGQKGTLQCILVMSALPPKADIAELRLWLKFAKLAGVSPDRVATGYS